MTKISGISTSSSSVADDDVFEKESAAGTSQKITGANLKAATLIAPGFIGMPLMRPNTAASFAAGNWGGRFIIVPRACQIVGVAAYVVTANGTSVVRPGVYSVSSTGTVNALLAQGPQVTGVSAGLTSLPLSSALTVTKGEALWVGWQVLTTSLATATVASAADGAFFAATGTLPDPASAATYNTSTALAFFAETN